jgi:hypothetical protein
MLRAVLYRSFASFAAPWPERLSNQKGERIAPGSPTPPNPDQFVTLTEDRDFCGTRLPRGGEPPRRPSTVDASVCTSLRI